jgi:hypothetical protein
LVALLILLGACGGGGPQDQAPAPTNNLLELLAYVPAGYEQHWVCVSSHRRFLDDAGFQDVQTSDQLEAALSSQSLSTQDRDALLLGPVGVPSAFARRWAMSTYKVRELVGLDFLQIEDYLSVGPDVFGVARLSFDSEALAAALEAQGYGREEHGGVPYYTIADDFDVATPVNEQGDTLPEGLALVMMSSMNRVWLQDGMLAVAPATQAMTDVMDAASGRMESVLDRKEYRRTAEGLGPVHAACFLDPAQVSFEALLRSTDPWVERFLVDEVLPQYPQWATLEPPDLVALGYYRRPDGTDVFKVGLWYNDEQKAKANAPELQKRLEQYQSTSADKPLCEEVEVHSLRSSDGSLALAECRGGLASHWIGQLNNNEHNIFLIESPADYDEVRP